MPKHVCRECGIALTGKRSTAIFCTPEHRKAWNNRRMIRGAEMYDLYMSRRYNREAATEANVWQHLDNLARAYRDADKCFRDGRQSWDLAEAIARLPMTYSTEGDKR